MLGVQAAFSHENWLEQTVYLSEGCAKWRDHFLSRPLRNGIVLTSSFPAAVHQRFFS
jgi:hypothetical protein